MYVLTDRKRIATILYLRKDWEEVQDAYSDDINLAITFTTFEEATNYKSPREEVIKIVDDNQENYLSFISNQ